MTQSICTLHRHAMHSCAADHALLWQMQGKPCWQWCTTYLLGCACTQADRQTWGALLLFSTLSSTAVPRPKVRPTTRLAPKTYRNLAKIANTVVLCSFMSFPRACTQSRPGCEQKRVQLRLQKQLKLASTEQASIVWSSDGALHLSVSNEECSQWPVDDSQAVLARSCDGQTLGACTVWLWSVTPGHAVLCLHECLCV